MVLNRLEDGTAVKLATNDNWKSNINVADILSNSILVGAFSLPDDSADSVLMQDLSQGKFTVAGSGVNDTTGVALVEFYDADTGASDVDLVNISIRAFVGTGGDIIIPGFVVKGGPIRVLIRAVGPTLSSFNVPGALADPKLTVFTGTIELFSNDNWQTNPAADETTTATTTVGAFDLEDGSRITNEDEGIVSVIVNGDHTVTVTDVNHVERIVEGARWVSYVPRQN